MSSLRPKLAINALPSPRPKYLKLSPQYPSDSRGIVIDLTSIHGNDQAYMQTACSNIKFAIDRLYSPGMDVETTRHISLFALAPIPLLVYLGSRLSNKFPSIYISFTATRKTGSGRMMAMPRNTFNWQKRDRTRPKSP